MTNPFTTLEIQLIRTSLTTKSDYEIAELLERPVTEVIEKINELTEGGAAERSIQVVELKQKLEKEKQQKKKGRPVTINKERRVIDKTYEDRENKASKKIRFNEKQRKNELGSRQINRKYKTLAVDYSNMKSVKVNKGTWIWVPKDMNEQAAIDHYHKQRDKRPGYVKEAEARMSNY